MHQLESYRRLEGSKKLISISKELQSSFIYLFQKLSLIKYTIAVIDSTAGSCHLLRIDIGKYYQEIGVPEMEQTLT